MTQHLEKLKFLNNKNIKLAKGLSSNELKNIEDKYEFLFPPDLRTILSLVLPISIGFPDWRNGDEIKLKRMLSWPIEGIYFDIRESNFWFSDWGEKPADINDALRIAEDELIKVPKLIPIYSHRYIPSEPYEEGNPVFSVYQTDIIYYGENLKNYFANEFDKKNINDSEYDEIKRIKFWSDLVDLNNSV